MPPLNDSQSTNLSNSSDPTLPVLPTSISQPANFTYEVPKKNTGKKILIGVATLIILGVSGFMAYAYVVKVSIFQKPPYTEENFLSSVIGKLGNIKQVSYKATASLKVNDREVDAKPFIILNSNYNELVADYQDDYTRAQDVQLLMGEILPKGNCKYLNSKYTCTTPPVSEFPKSLDEINKSILNSKKSDSSSFGTFHVADPLGKPYEYKQTENGKNFEFKVTFATREAIRVIKRSSNYTSTSTPISGLKVTFTKDSPTYFYLSQQPPKPLIEALSEASRYLPAELSAEISMSATTEVMETDKPASFKANTSFTGDFGDLRILFDADILRSGEFFYFRISKIPSLFGLSLANLKGKWVEVPLNATTTTGSYGGPVYDPVTSIAKGLPNYEKQYREKRKESAEIFKKVLQIADEKKFLTFKDKPVQVNLGDRNLYRYNLEFNRESILPFYRELSIMFAEEKNKDYRLSIFDDPGMLEYLESAEFKEIFAYYEANTSMTLWIDKEGYPAQFEYRIRLVPPETATQLKDKQGDIILLLNLNDINEPVNIEKPADAISLEQATKDTSSNMYNTTTGKGRDQFIKSNLSGIRVQAELYYDKSNKYSQVTYSAGPCVRATTISGTLFSDTAIIQSLKDATNNDLSKAVCSTNGANYAVSVELDTDPSYSWCIDSNGTSKQIRGTITKFSCE